MSLVTSRVLRVSLIVAALIVGLSLGGLGKRSIARADDPPATAPASEPAGPTAEQLLADLHEDLQAMGNDLGGFNDDQKAKIAALEKSVGDQLKADITKFRDENFQNSVLAQFRDILTPDQQKKFDAKMEESKKIALEIKTASNLRMIGQMCFLYANDNNGKYAPNLGGLVVEDATPDNFLAGGSKTTAPADWKTMDAAAKADWVNKNTDFVYLAGGQTSSAPATFVMVYIKPEAAGAHNIFLMGDGSVVNKTVEEAKPIIDDLKAGKNPPAGMGTN